MFGARFSDVAEARVDLHERIKAEDTFAGPGGVPVPRMPEFAPVVFLQRLPVCRLVGEENR